MGKEMKEKTLGNTDIKGAKVNVPDIVVFGDGDKWQLICKASSLSEGWMKSTKAMEVPGGCFVQVTTQQKNPDGSYAIAEAIAFAPGIRVVTDERRDADKNLITVERRLMPGL